MANHRGGRCNGLCSADSQVLIGIEVPRWDLPRPFWHQQNGRFSAGNRPKIYNRGRGRPLSPFWVCGIDFWHLFTPSTARVYINNTYNGFSIKKFGKVAFFFEAKICHFSAQFWTTKKYEVLLVEISTPRFGVWKFLLHKMTHQGSFPYFMACQLDTYFLISRCTNFFWPKKQEMDSWA